MDERLCFVSLVNESDESFAALCEQFGISRKTGYKWVARYETLGPRGLEERRPVPRTFPHATPTAILDALLELRKERPTWGPKKLRARLESLGVAHLPAPSTIGELLKKHGLIRPRRRRVHTPRTPSMLAPAEQPNDTWCVDFKGHFGLRDKSRCHPLTLTDQASRFLLKCEGVAKPDELSVRPHFEHAFREFGLPERIRSDNGPPFATLGPGGLSALSVSWIKLGIHPERIDPGHPEQNGRHERMHKTLKAEATAPPEATLADQQRAFDRFRHDYNDERPHEALGQRTPASRYTPSRRAMPSKPSSPEYEDTMIVRRIDEKGKLWLGGTKRRFRGCSSTNPSGFCRSEKTCGSCTEVPVTASSQLANAHPNQEFSGIIQLGHKASDLGLLHQTVLDPRLPPNTLSTLIADLDLFGAVVPGAKQTRLESKVATADQGATLEAGCELIRAVRSAVKKARASKEVQKAYGVGHAVSPRVVRDVKAALKLILDRANENPDEAASLGIVKKDLEAIAAVHQAITDADKAQEQKRARAPLSTQDRNRTANRILDAVARIAGAGGLEFAGNPEVLAAFRTLKPPSKNKKKVAAKPAPASASAGV